MVAWCCLSGVRVMRVSGSIDRLADACAARASRCACRPTACWHRAWASIPRPRQRKLHGTPANQQQHASCLWMWQQCCALVRTVALWRARALAGCRCASDPRQIPRFKLPTCCVATSMGVRLLPCAFTRYAPHLPRLFVRARQSAPIHGGSATPSAFRGNAENEHKCQGHRPNAFLRELMVADSVRECRLFLHGGISHSPTLGCGPQRVERTTHALSHKLAFRSSS